MSVREIAAQLRKLADKAEGLEPGLTESGLELVDLQDKVSQVDEELDVLKEAAAEEEDDDDDEEEDEDDEEDDEDDDED